MLLKRKSWTPYEYQKKSIKFLLQHPEALLLQAPGLGKTSITLAALKILKKKKILNKALVVAPLRVCYSVWPEEVKKWKDFKDLKVVVLHGPKKEALLKEEADIYVINFEGLKWLLNKHISSAGNPLTVKWKKLGFDTLVIDELSKFKNSRSKRFKMMKQFHGLFERRWGLTGSPASNGLMDLFGQLYIIDQGKSLGRYITQYRSKYFVPDYTGFNWTICEGSEEEIYEKISPISLRMAAEDYLDMPDLVDNYITVDLPKNARKIYDTLEKILIAEINGKTVTAASAAVASSKIRQITNGGCYIDEEETSEFFSSSGTTKEWENIHDAKIDALEELFDEMQGTPVLVAYEFKHDLDRIKKRFGKDVPYIGGGVSAKKSVELERAWNAGELPYLFGHPQSIGHGLNLQQSGNHIVWLSLTWDYELYDQFIRRVYRQGNEEAQVFNHHIIARDTIDEKIVRVLQRKERGQNSLFTALDQLAKSRKY